MLGVEVITWLQQTLPWLAPVMAAVSRLGAVEVYVVGLGAVYWAASPSLGARVGVLLLASSGINAALKLAAGAPRPYWVAPEVTAHAAEPSYGFPSGHAQNAAAVWGRLAAASDRRGVWVAAAALIAVIGVSRWPLGVHTPVDTLGGFAVGAGLVAIALRAEPRLLAWLGRRGTRGRLAAALGASLALLALWAAAELSPLAGPPLPTWADQARAAAPGVPLDPTSPAPVVRAAGALLGFGAGLALLARRGGVAAGGSVMRRALRCVVGLAGVAALTVGAEPLLPVGDSPGALALRYARFALLGLWVAWLAPVVFVRLGLASPSRPRRTGAAGLG